MAAAEYNMTDLMASKTIKLIGGPADGKEFLVLIPAANTYYFSNGTLTGVSSGHEYEKESKTGLYKYRGGSLKEQN